MAFQRPLVFTDFPRERERERDIIRSSIAKSLWPIARYPAIHRGSKDLFASLLPAEREPFRCRVRITTSFIHFTQKVPCNFARLRLAVSPCPSLRTALFILYDVCPTFLETPDEPGCATRFREIRISRVVQFPNPVANRDSDSVARSLELSNFISRRD